MDDNSSKIFMGADMNDSYINYLNDRYQNIKKGIVEGGGITKEDLELIKEIGVSLPHEKSNHDNRPFNVSIPPEYLLHILKK